MCLCSFVWRLGVKVIFRVGLVLLKCMLGSQEKLKACQGQYETMERLRAVEPCYMQEGFLVKEVHRTHTHTLFHTVHLKPTLALFSKKKKKRGSSCASEPLRFHLACRHVGHDLSVMASRQGTSNPTGPSSGQCVSLQV